MKKLLIILTFFIIGCSSRKVNKSDTKEESKTEIVDTSKQTESKQSETNTNVKETKSTTIDKENNIVSDVTEITPDDKTKPASVKLPNGQIIDITNAKYRNEKKDRFKQRKKRIVIRIPIVTKKTLKLLLKLMSR